jgi:formyl-CoA transferase
MAGPLTGIRVLELGSLIAGPFCAKTLADFGAEVIKIEPPGEGDPLRKWRRMRDGTSLWWQVQSRNKKSVTCNLRRPEGQDIVRRLARTAHIVVENFRPGALEKWNLGWEQLAAQNPKLVMVRISGYGQTGPYKERPGFAAIAEGMGGFRYVNGFPDRPPARPNLSIGDTIASLHGVMGALMALREAEKTGKGQVVDVALYEAIFAMMESMVPEFDVFGFIRERTGNIMPGITPSSIHTSADGKHVQIGANGDAIFKRFMQAIGRNDLADDPTLASNDGRDARRDELYGVIDRWANSLPLEQVMQVLTAAEVPASRIYSAEDMFNDPQYLAREMFLQARLPDGKAFKMPGIVPKLSETPGSAEWVGPALGEHTDALLGTLGYDAAAIASLRQAGTV